MWNPEYLLRYRISSWRQLPKCRSNNSRDLNIRVSDFINNNVLRGFNIQVYHPKYGVLFATTLEARGVLVTDDDEYGRTQLSTETILKELHKFGFFITYYPISNLSSAELNYLLVLQQLGYDKLRMIQTAYSANVETSYKVIAFQVDKLTDWLNNMYNPTESEFTQALMDGTAINLTEISETRKMSWGWLKDKVVDINDVIRDNADQMIEFQDPEETHSDDDDVYDDMDSYDDYDDSDDDEGE